MNADRRSFLFFRMSLACSVMLVALACAGGENLLENPGFEGGMTGWREANPVWRVENGAGYNGTKGLVYENDDPDRYIYPAQYIRLEPGFAYRIRGLAKNEGVKGGTPTIGISYVDREGKWISDVYGHLVDDNGILKDGWQMFEVTTKAMPDNVGRGGVLCFVGKGGTGRARFDDISIEKVELKPIAFLVSSAYRDTAEKGSVRFYAEVNANPAAYALTLAFTGADGSVKNIPPVEFTRSQAVFELDVEALAPGRQKLKAVMTAKADGKVRDTQELAFTRAVPERRRVTFDLRGRMLLDGRKIFPLGCYMGWGIDDALMERYTRGPYNFLVKYGGTDVKQLDACRRAGVYMAVDVRGMIFGYSYATKSGCRTLADSKERLRNLHETIGSHPNLLMWYLNDEAPVDHMPNIAQVHQYLHELDPDRATLTCLCHPKTAGNFLPSYDVLAHDCYPIGNTRGPRGVLERVTRQMRECIAEMRGMKPIWFIPQAIDWKWYYTAEVQKTCDQDHLRMPTRREMANMTWQSVACGANGIVFYSYSAIFKDEKDPTKAAEYWADTCGAASEVKKFEDVLLADDFPVSREGVPEFVVVRAWHHVGRDWYLVVNATRDRQTAKIPLNRYAVTLRTALGSGVSLSADGTALDCAFGPMEYAFVEIENK